MKNASLQRLSVSVQEAKSRGQSLQEGIFQVKSHGQSLQEDIFQAQQEVSAGSKSSQTVSAEAKYDRQSLQEAKIGRLVYTLYLPTHHILKCCCTFVWL